MYFFFLNQLNLAIRRTKGRLDFTVMLIPSKTKITFGLLKLLSAIPTRLRRFVQILGGSKADKIRIPFLCRLTQKCNRTRQWLIVFGFSQEVRGYDKISVQFERSTGSKIALFFLSGKVTVFIWSLI